MTDARDQFLADISYREKMRRWRSYLNKANGSTDYARACLAMMRAEPLLHAILKAYADRLKYRTKAVRVEYNRLRRESYARRNPFEVIG